MASTFEPVTGNGAYILPTNFPAGEPQFISGGDTLSVPDLLRTQAIQRMKYLGAELEAMEQAARGMRQELETLQRVVSTLGEERGR